MDFAVQLEGEEQGQWVLDIDPIGERFLLVNSDGTFRWVEMSDCKLIKARNPDQPLPVVMVQQGPQLAIPSLHLGPNGG